MSDVCVAQDKPDLEKYSAFGALAAFAGQSDLSYYYNLFDENAANDGSGAIIGQLLNLPKEEQPEYIHIFDYTGTDYTSVVQESAASATDLFGTDVTFYSGAGRLILDEVYIDLLVNGAIALAAGIPYAMAPFVGNEFRAEALSNILNLREGVVALNQVACQSEYQDNPVYYAGLLQQCANGTFPVHPWFSTRTIRFRIDEPYMNFTDIPESCISYEDGGCGINFDSIYNDPMMGNYIVYDDEMFLEAESLGDDANCYIETRVVESVASMTQQFLPFCGTRAQNIQIEAAMLGYYFGKTSGIFCKDQTSEFLVGRMIERRSKCYYDPLGGESYIPPCTVRF